MWLQLPRNVLDLGSLQTFSLWRRGEKLPTKMPGCDSTCLVKVEWLLHSLPLDSDCLSFSTTDLIHGVPFPRLPDTDAVPLEAGVKNSIKACLGYRVSSGLAWTT